KKSEEVEGLEEGRKKSGVVEGMGEGRKKRGVVESMAERREKCKKVREMSGTNKRITPRELDMMILGQVREGGMRTSMKMIGADVETEAAI
ncbi:hypothetical protein CEJ83_20245, partial [Acinetobacter baumannii]